MAVRQARLDDPQRATLWGHAAPASWFEDASRVESIVDGAFVETRPPRLADRPSFVG